ncbi:hypothetical protein [Thauera chlorobenzoica]|uniref:Membrane protein n=1 Tax=Thauera chlorobenzoica TaxID=96773 RepID=A0A1H5TRU2_9RHOO|nr:hypothetical protein [Thauera chlorobenzoica]APR06025.1 membrane protein [Thauera chlorobenzoica]SEF65513.1 hypothetical protein SAMN05216242_103161 [Thauera chlorobenzoica]
MQKWIQVLWPSFLVAAIAEAVFFLVIDPRTLYLFGEPVDFGPVATYSIAFFCFWLVCAASSLGTVFLQRSARQINRKR